MKNKLLFIIGPTASGKTSLSIDIAERFGGEIISCDSMQIYEGMNIGTATPSKEEMRGIPHHLMSFVKPDSDYSVANYQKDALDEIGNIIQKNKRPILVGGTGLYVNALTYKLDFTGTSANSALRCELSEKYDTLGGEYMHAELKKLDPDAAERIHPNDKLRIIRRLEILTGGDGGEYDFRVESDDFDFLMIALNKPREALYADINKRVDMMFEEGLEKEAREIISSFGKDAPALKAIGYKELVSAWNGEISIEEAKELIKRNSRRYAKRQLTWFKRDKRIKWFNIGEYSSLEAMRDEIFKTVNEWYENGGHTNAE